MTSAWEKVRRHPVHAATSAFKKLLVEPRRYSRPDGYDSKQYWQDRFTRHGTSLRGVGDEGLTQQENERDYAHAKDVFRSFVVERCKVDFASGATLEIGCGTGFYTRALQSLGAHPLVAYDITDALFPDLRAELPTIEFRQADITADKPEGSFKNGVMIDVLEHVVTRERFCAALRNVADALVDDGKFIVGPFAKAGSQRRALYYFRTWSTEDVRACLPEWGVEATTEFRDGELLLLARTAT